MELLLDQHPCWIQAAGERYPTHLAGAYTNVEFAATKSGCPKPRYLIATVAGSEPLRALARNLDVSRERE
jgi:hypothetical protein